MQLLEQLDKGKALDISGIPDEYAHKKVQEVFDNVSLLRRRSNGTYVLREAGGSVLALVAPILDERKESLERVYKTSVGLDEKGEDNLGRRGEGESEKKDTDVNTDPVDTREERPMKKSYGPTMPTTTELKMAEELMEQQNSVGEDPLFGPVPPEFLEDLQGMCIIVNRLYVHHHSLDAFVDAESDDVKVAEVGRIMNIIEEHNSLGLLGDNASAIPPNPYIILGLDQTCSASEVKKRFWKLSLLIHPDKCSHPAAATVFDAVSTAAKRLQDADEKEKAHRQIDDMERMEMVKAIQKEKERETAWKIARGEIKASDVKPVGPAKREEWMTHLPTTKPRSNQVPEKSSTSFKSRSSVPQDQSWTLRPGEQGPQLPSAPEPSPRETQVPVRKEKSLLERHLEKQASSGVDSLGNKTSAAQGKYRPFDRDRDLQIKKKGPQPSLESMRGLGSRFGKGSFT